MQNFGVFAPGSGKSEKDSFSPGLMGNGEDGPALVSGVLEHIGDDLDFRFRKLIGINTRTEGSDGFEAFGLDLAGPEIKKRDGDSEIPDGLFEGDEGSGSLDSANEDFFGCMIDLSEEKPAFDVFDQGIFDANEDDQELCEFFILEEFKHTVQVLIKA